MSKRLIRIFPPHLPDRLPDLVAHEVNIVLHNGRTFFGYLESHTLQSLLLRDLRGHRHSIELSDVDVLILDQPVLSEPNRTA